MSPMQELIDFMKANNLLELTTSQMNEDYMVEVKISKMEEVDDTDE